MHEEELGSIRGISLTCGCMFDAAFYSFFEKSWISTVENVMPCSNHSTNPSFIAAVNGKHFSKQDITSQPGLITAKICQIVGSALNNKAKVTIRSNVANSVYNYPLDEARAKYEGTVVRNDRLTSLQEESSARVRNRADQRELRKEILKKRLTLDKENNDLVKHLESM